MKTILYSIFTILLFGVFTLGFASDTNPKNCILIQSANENISAALLSQSAEIISARLRDFSTDSFDITILPANKQIQVTLSNSWDLKAAEKLLVQKGTFAFYETYNHKSLTELLDGDNHLFSLMVNVDTINSSAKIGCTSISEVEKVNDYINSHGLDQKCKFMWGQESDSSRVCLYALRSYNENGALLKGSDIKSMRFVHNLESKDYDIEIRFKKEVIELWSDATKRNINKAIAIVLDNKVIFDPKLNEIIESGNCQISGDLTIDKVRYIVALGNNGELPADFKIIK